MSNTWLHRFAVLVAACTLVLVVAGASVTSFEAGLSVPDWPLSYGKIMPEMTGGVFYEHGHRMIATTVGFLTIILAVWLWRTDERRWMRRLGWIALGLVILQGLFGGLTVLFRLPRGVSITHACLAQLFFSTTVAIALFTSRSWRQGPQLVLDEGSPSLRSLSLLPPIVILGQIILGAAYRHKLLGLIPHVIGALVVAGVVLIVAMFALQQFPKHGAIKNAAIALIFITMIQIFLGIGAYMGRLYTAEGQAPQLVMVALTVAHVAAGALTMASGVVFAIQIHRNVRHAAGAHARSVSVPS